jgi:hypothetical protein
MIYYSLIILFDSCLIFCYISKSKYFSYIIYTLLFWEEETNQIYMVYHSDDNKELLII